MTAGKIVGDEDVEASLEEMPDGYGADIAGSAGD
jgi:hypothetical protein